MTTILKMPPHPWTHLVTVLEHCGVTSLGGDQIIRAETQEITKRKSSYRPAKIVNLTLLKENIIPSNGTKTAAKLNGTTIINMLRPDITIDKISLNLAAATTDGMNGLLNLYLNTHYTSRQNKEYRKDIVLSLNDGYVRAKCDFTEAKFNYGSIIIDQEIPRSIQAAMRGDLLSSYVEHESIDPLAVITHVIERSGEIHIDYDVRSVSLDEIFGPLKEYLKLKNGTKVMIDTLKGKS